MAEKNEERLDRGEEADSKAAVPLKKSRGNLFVILVGLLVMILAPAASYLVVKLTITEAKPDAPKADPVAASPNPVVMTMDAMTVNISGTRMTRLLRFQPHLVLSDPRLEAVLNPAMLPMIKDRIMATASRRTLDELEQMENREALKRDIAMEINAMVRDRMVGSVIDVVFSEFLIQ